MSHLTAAKKAATLTQPKYSSFLHASHCQHLDDALSAISHVTLIPARLNATTATIRSKVLWYTLGFSSGHSMYGNVSFVTEWRRITSKLGSRLYYIDQTMSADRCCTRLLLTRSSYEGAFQEVDNVHGSPIIEKMGQPFHVVRCLNKNNSDGPHEVKLAVEADEGEAHWLFSVSQVIVNDHFFVNLPIDKQRKRRDGRIQRYKQHKCGKYNTDLNALCPFQLRREDAGCKVRDYCPGIVISDILDLTVKVEQTHGQSIMKTLKDDSSDGDHDQTNPSIQQHYNCLADPKNMSRKEKNISGEISSISPISDIVASAGAAIETVLVPRGALTCDQYHRYRPTKEDDAFQQGHLDTATYVISVDTCNRTVVGQRLSCDDRSPQIHLAKSHSERLDNGLVSLYNNSVRHEPLASLNISEYERYDKETENIGFNGDEVVEPKLEIDLMKMALDDVKCKLLKLEKALTKSNQSSSPDTNSKISDENFSNFVPKSAKQDMILKETGGKGLSVGNEITKKNESINSGNRVNKAASWNEKLDPGSDFTYKRLLTDAMDSNQISVKQKIRGQSEASRGVSLGGRDDAPLRSAVTGQKKRSSTLYKSTLSSAVKARAKR